MVALAACASAGHGAPLCRRGGGLHPHPRTVRQARRLLPGAAAQGRGAAGQCRTWRRRRPGMRCAPSTKAVEQHRLAAASAALMAVAAGPDLVLDALLMFGAIGYTWEHDTHLYWRRAISLAASIGPTTRWSREAGELARTLKRSTAINLGDVESDVPGIGGRRRSTGRRRCTTSTPPTTPAHPVSPPATQRDLLAERRPGRSPSARAVGRRRLGRAAGDHHRGVRQASRPDPAVARHRRVDPADDPRQRNRPAARPVRLADAARHPTVVPAVQRAGRRLGPGVVEHTCPQGRRRVAGQRAQDLDVVGRPSAVRSPAGAHRPGRVQAPRDQLLPHRHDVAGRRRSSRSNRPAGTPTSTRSSSPTCSFPTTCWSATPGAGWDLAVATMAVERTAIGNYVNIDRSAALRQIAADRRARPGRRAARLGRRRGVHHRHQGHGAARNPAAGGGPSALVRRRASPSTRW